MQVRDSDLACPSPAIKDLLTALEAIINVLVLHNFDLIAQLQLTQPTTTQPCVSTL